MTEFLDSLARDIARPMSRTRALRLLGGAVVAATVPGIAPRKAHAASRFHRCEPEGGRLCECNCKGEACQRICCTPREDYECNCGTVEEGAGCKCIRPCGSNANCCKSGEYCASAKQGLCCKEGEPGCDTGCCKKNEECTGEESERVCKKRCPKNQAWCGKKKCCPPGTVCCNKESGVCCKTRAACCGATRTTATSRGTFCCRGRGKQGPICVDKSRDICCRSGEVPCIRRYEEAKYPCCPSGSTCCGSNCCPKGTVCCSEESGVCCKSKAACCGATRPTATSRGPFCCSGTGIQGPVCVDKTRDICCRSGEVACIGAFETGKYPCCAGGTTCCGDGCVDTQRDPKNCGSCGNVCESGICGGGICAFP